MAKRRPPAGTGPEKAGGDRSCADGSGPRRGTLRERDRVVQGGDALLVRKVPDRARLPADLRFAVDRRAQPRRTKARIAARERIRPGRPAPRGEPCAGAAAASPPARRLREPCGSAQSTAVRGSRPQRSAAPAGAIGCSRAPEPWRAKGPSVTGPSGSLPRRAGSGSRRASPVSCAGRAGAGSPSGAGTLDGRGGFEPGYPGGRGDGEGPNDAQPLRMVEPAPRGRAVSPQLGLLGSRARGRPPLRGLFGAHEPLELRRRFLEELMAGFRKPNLHAATVVLVRNDLDDPLVPEPPYGLLKGSQRTVRLLVDRPQRDGSRIGLGRRKQDPPADHGVSNGKPLLRPVEDMQESAGQRAAGEMLT